jgi:hypothetical protein
VVVDDLDVFWAEGRPYKTNAELIVDPDAVLTSAILLQSFKPIARRNAQIVQSPGYVQLFQFASCHSLNAAKASDALTME